MARRHRTEKAIVTATYLDGAKWGWPGERVIRYETLTGAMPGSWAWMPDRTRKVGDVIIFRVNAPKKGRLKHRKKTRGW
jgi:hypothetical protein